VQVFTKAPNAVVFLDEFEKGHCEGIPPLLLKMLDKDGRLTGMLYYLYHNAAAIGFLILSSQLF
jgi:hypothetical protein